MLSLCASVASAQTAPAKKTHKAAPAPAAAMDKAATEKALIANEQKINDAVVKSDVATMKTLVAAEAIAADDSGFMNVEEFYKLMATPGAVKVTDVKLSDFKVLWVDANTAVLTYTFAAKGTMAGQPIKSPTYSSSVYNKRGDKWLVVFHQETPKVPAPPAPAKKK
mgnify:CR=1 FL=1